MARTYEEVEIDTRIAMELFDSDCNGLITVEEFYSTFKKHGYDVDKEELSIIVENVDQDGDGAINFSEMLTIMMRMHHQNRKQEELIKVFEILDKDGNKRISKSELKKALRLYGRKKVTTEELDNIMRQVDFDNDGYISFVEFSNNVHLFQ